MASNEACDVHIVEKVLKKRSVSGSVQYLLKWVGCSNKENSWEPEENVRGNVLVEQFNRIHSKNADGIRNSSSPNNDTNLKHPVGRQSAAEMGLGEILLPETEQRMKINRILGSIDVNGELMFFVQVEERSEPIIVTARLANVVLPHLVIDYYQNQLEMEKET